MAAATSSESAPAKKKGRRPRWNRGKKKSQKDSSAETEQPATEKQADKPAKSRKPAPRQSKPHTVGPLLQCPPPPQGADRRDVLAYKLATETLDCPICLKPVRARSQVSACRGCHEVFHLACLKKWAAVRQLDGGKSFACPCCNLVQHTEKAYRCFCGKETNPVTPAGATPHTCGALCGKTRPHCPHPCPLPCHPGSCPECGALGPTVVCFCGKSTHATRCGSDPRAGWSCGDVCGRPLACGHHTCTLPCHDGPCPECPQTSRTSCHCGAVSRDLPCGSAAFSCGQSCPHGQPCPMVCHEGLCPTLALPGQVVPRTVPADLSCGHAGHAVALSSGAVEFPPIPLPCTADTTVSCRCGRTTVTVPCRDLGTSPLALVAQALTGPVTVGQLPQEALTVIRGITPQDRRPTRIEHLMFVLSGGLPTIGLDQSAGEYAIGRHSDAWPTCTRRCDALLACGVHRCTRVCCDGADHACHRSCAKPLSCGKHRCPLPCHTGACPPCSEVVSTQTWTCACGRTHVPPPIRCGDVMPQCPHPCPRRRECGHPVDHGCHEGQCPPCTARVPRVCAGGHTKVWAACGSPCPKPVSCGASCNRPLPCGHRCHAKCHDGVCPPCTDPCGKRLPCGHACSQPCGHGGECGPCEAVELARCACGLQQLRVPCSPEPPACTPACVPLRRARLAPLAGRNLTMPGVELSAIPTEPGDRPAPATLDLAHTAFVLHLPCADGPARLATVPDVVGASTVAATITAVEFEAGVPDTVCGLPFFVLNSWSDGLQFLEPTDSGEDDDEDDFGLFRPPTEAIEWDAVIAAWE
ncbi:NF-X1 type zinc finger [Carpediemonas membranifera]|uniref:NF-X1 type zinc finger n=1 Tax=Carpediemonas membranifera TaxID=201153 RepID=A0A8J6B7Z9_9EUKA|nr:NF-X1 type zinc finger [Carpediemonas membranifera]|eukprot:KAG9391917.1 NF-X1 type zinc finger [Carpediemonas membranifera]